MANTSKYELVGSIDSSAGATITQHADRESEFSDLIRQLIASQNRQNALLQEVVNQLSAAQRQRSFELAQWRRANPELAQSCKAAAESLGKIQSTLLSKLAFEIDASFEDLQDSEYMLNDFFDKYGPRISHLNTLLQTLSILGNAPDFGGTISNP